MPLDAQPWRERYTSHKSPFLRFAAREGRAPTLIEKIGLCEALEDLEDFLEGMRDIYRMGARDLIECQATPDQIKNAAALRRAEIGKEVALRAKNGLAKR